MFILRCEQCSEDIGGFANGLGVDRLSAWTIIGADIKHFTDYRYRPF